MIARLGVCLTPSRLLSAFLAVEVCLVLASQWQGLPLSQRARLGLGAVVAAGGILLLLSVWFGAALVFRWQFKFGIRCLLALVAAVAIACGWLTSEVSRAKRQRQLAAAARDVGSGPFYDYNLSDAGELRFFSGMRPGSSRLEEVLGEDFFHEIAGVQLRTDAALRLFENQTSLRRIYGHDSQLTDAGLKSVASLKRLTWLDLRDAPAVTDVGIEHIEKLSHLECLMLRRTGVTDEGMAHLKNLHQLKILDLAMTQVTHNGLKHLSGLTQLRQLLFWGNNIEDSGVVHIRGMTQLEILDLGFAPLTDAGLENLRGLRDLRRLTLRGSRLTDAGLQHLARLDQLQQLDLYRTRVSDVGLEHLQGLSRLTSLHLGETRVTPEGIQKFQRALPECKVQR